MKQIYIKSQQVNFLLSTGQHSDGQNIIFTDGEYINQIAACKDVCLSNNAVITQVPHMGILQSV